MANAASRASNQHSFRYQIIGLHVSLICLLNLLSSWYGIVICSYKILTHKAINTIHPIIFFRLSFRIQKVISPAIAAAARYAKGTQMKKITVYPQLPKYAHPNPEKIKFRKTASKGFFGFIVLLSRIHMKRVRAQFELY